MNNTGKRYRILHIITRLDLGGSAENTLVTAIGLAQKGCDVTIVCGRSDNPPSRNEKKAAESGVRIVRIGQMCRSISPLRDCITLLRLWRHIRNGAYDIVHTHTSKAGILGRIAARMAGARRIVHTPHGHIFYGYFSSLVTGIFIILERFATGFTDIQITLTGREKKDYLERGIGRDDMTVPVFSGVDLGRYMNPGIGKREMRGRLGIEPDRFVAGTVARLVPVKNHDLIISAAVLLKQDLPEMHFIFAGDGDLRESLENRIASLGLNSLFSFIGWRDDIPQVMTACDIFVMCSRNEGMGRAFVEAQAAGLPVVGTDVGGVAEVLLVEKTGYLARPGDPGSVAHAIRMLYARRNELPEIARACREWVNPRFSVETMVDTIYGLYMRLPAGKGR